jgi:hypothetical protein
LVQCYYYNPGKSRNAKAHTHTHKAHGPKHKISLKFFNVLKKDFNEK